MKYTVEDVKKSLCNGIDRTVDYINRNTISNIETEDVKSKYAEWKERIQSEEFDILDENVLEDFRVFDSEVVNIINLHRLDSVLCKEAEPTFDGAQFDEPYYVKIREADYSEYVNNEQREWNNFPLTFWEIVDKLNWKDEKNYHKLSWRLFKLCNMSTYILNEFSSIFDNYVRVLKATIVEYDLKTNGKRHSGKLYKGGDDSFDDLVTHIVGMGEAIYKTCLLDPRAISVFVDRYTESFRYVFQLPECFYYYG